MWYIILIAIILIMVVWQLTKSSSRRSSIDKQIIESFKYIPDDRYSLVIQIRMIHRYYSGLRMWNKTSRIHVNGELVLASRDLAADLPGYELNNYLSVKYNCKLHHAYIDRINSANNIGSSFQATTELDNVGTVRLILTHETYK